MIEEYPATRNPNKDTVEDVISTLNINLAKKITQLTAISLCSIAGLIE
jgi:hypothetical protein